MAMQAVLVNTHGAKLIAAGYTYRQLDYWWRLGWIGDRHNVGSGQHRDWSTVTERDLWAVELAMCLCSGRRGQPEYSSEVLRQKQQLMDDAMFTFRGATFMLSYAENPELLPEWMR